MNNYQHRPQPRRASRPRPKMLARIGVCEESGQALVELVIVLPLLLLLLFGIAEFGLALNAANDETHLASEVARYAAVNQNPAAKGTLAEWAISQADTNFLQSNGQVSICFPKGTANVGDPVQVTVKAPMHWLPILELGETTISGTATMRLEAPPTVDSAEPCPPSA
jgi:Flp pilus assembly protein TadG